MITIKKINNSNLYESFSVSQEKINSRDYEVICHNKKMSVNQGDNQLTRYYEDWFSFYINYSNAVREVFVKLVEEGIVLNQQFIRNFLNFAWLDYNCMDCLFDDDEQNSENKYLENLLMFVDKKDMMDLLLDRYDSLSFIWKKEAQPLNIRDRLVYGWILSHLSLLYLGFKKILYLRYLPYYHIKFNGREFQFIRRNEIEKNIVIGIRDLVEMQYQ